MATHVVYAWLDTASFFFFALSALEQDFCWSVDRTYRLRDLLFSVHLISGCVNSKDFGVLRADLWLWSNTTSSECITGNSSATWNFFNEHALLWDEELTVVKIESTSCGDDTNIIHTSADVFRTCGPGLCYHLSEYCTLLKSVTL